MKILFFDTTQAFLNPGGKTVHAIKLHQELLKLGVDVEFARWWDESQNDFDIIHFFSAANGAIINMAKKKRRKILLTHIMDFETSKSKMEMKKSIIKLRLLQMLPLSFQSRFDWFNLPFFDHIVYMHKYDLNTALKYFPKLSKNNLSVIPHAYDPKDMGIGSHVKIENVLPKKYLISCGTICERKQSILLAKLAKSAESPIVFIGSYLDTDPYYHAFKKEIDNKYVFYLGYVDKEIKDYVESRASGFVLLSKGESGCIAIYEAAAYKLPLLLSNLPWAWGYEDPTDLHFCDFNNEVKAVKQLKVFFNRSKKMDHTPFAVNSWAEIANKYKHCYEEILLK
mgnify:CR=1 FL=1